MLEDEKLGVNIGLAPLSWSEAVMMRPLKALAHWLGVTFFMLAIEMNVYGWNSLAVF